MSVVAIESVIAGVISSQTSIPGDLNFSVIASVRNSEVSARRELTVFCKHLNPGLMFKCSLYQGSNRRWSSIQAQEFTHLYSVLATLVCSCDVSSQLTVGKGATNLSLKFLDFALNLFLISQFISIRG